MMLSSTKCTLDKLYLQNVRCFANKELQFSSSITLIEGYNGSGKTTIVEALYYLCYLRSFRTNITKDLIHFDSDSFFIRASLLSEGNTENLQVGFSPAKRQVKLNDSVVSSFKEITKNYRVVVLTEEDLNIIKGGPDTRRNFIDQYIYLQNPSWFEEIRSYRHAVDSRNALLKSKSCDVENNKVWTDQIIKKSGLIRAERLKALSKIEQETNKLLKEHFKDALKLQFEYRKKEWRADLSLKEQILERTLFGAHLDDYRIKLDSKSTRKFASRGQQKLVAILLKTVQVALLKESFFGAILFLLDDFITDLDDQNSETLVKLLVDLSVQLVFTAPNMPIKHKNLLIELGAKTITI